MSMKIHYYHSRKSAFAELSLFLITTISYPAFNVINFVFFFTALLPDKTILCLFNHVYGLG